MEFIDALEARWACKLYDETRDVSPEEEAVILEAGRLAPTSFGLEHWRFVSVRGQTPRLQLYSACLSQDVVRTAPLIVIVLVRQARYYTPDSDFVKARAARFPGGWPVFYDDYKGYHEWLEAGNLTGHWAKAQAYLACANMMNAASSIGVDSCAIEGYKEAEVLDIVALAAPGFDAADWRVGLIVTFGRAGEPRRQRIRASLEELVLKI
ncbi:MAG: nitroreductase family protein [Spirochaetota bacterium]